MSEAENPCPDEHIAPRVSGYPPLSWVPAKALRQTGRFLPYTGLGQCLQFRSDPNFAKVCGKKPISHDESRASVAIYLSNVLCCN